MEPVKLNHYRRSGPEGKIQDDLMAWLKIRDWFVIATHGSEFQMGLPDLYAAHYTLGTRWIEVKNPAKYSFTSAQMQVFPMLQSKGIGIWILCYCDQYEYDKLFQPPNWSYFLGRASMLRTPQVING